MTGQLFLSVVCLVVVLHAANGFRMARTVSRSSLFMSTVVDDKTEVEEYFNNEGFNRWNKIYSESDEVCNEVDIRHL